MYREQVSGFASFAFLKIILCAFASLRSIIKKLIYKAASAQELAEERGGGQLVVGYGREIA